MSMQTVAPIQPFSGISRGRMLFIFLLGIFMGALDHGIIGPALSSILSTYQVSESWGVWSLLGNLIGGYSTDRIGAAKTLHLSLTGFSLVLLSVSFLMWLTPSSTTVLLAAIVSLLWGIPGFALNPALNSYLISLNPQQASMILSFGASALRKRMQKL